jgi:hypothetical protein
MIHGPLVLWAFLYKFGLLGYTVVVCICRRSKCRIHASFSRTFASSLISPILTDLAPIST